jgi:hypothetical protein
VVRHRQGPALEATLHELTYLPMIELLKYLRANGYRTYIVTGGGQDFVRVYSEAFLCHFAFRIPSLLARIGLKTAGSGDFGKSWTRLEAWRGVLSMSKA